MSHGGSPGRVTYRRTGAPGASQYEVLQDGRSMGSVARFTMGAAQFGSTWLARTPSGRASSRFPSRDAAAAWLVGEALAERP